MIDPIWQLRFYALTGWFQSHQLEITWFVAGAIVGQYLKLGKMASAFKRIRKLLPVIAIMAIALPAHAQDTATPTPSETPTATITLTPSVTPTPTPDVFIYATVMVDDETSQAVAYKYEISVGDVLIAGVAGVQVLMLIVLIVYTIRRR